MQADAVRPISEMRILAFCDYFSPESSGGSERVAREVYTRLAQRGAAIELVTIANSRRPAVAEVGGIRVHQMPLFDLSRALRAQVAIAPSLLRHIPSIARGFGPNVLHANNIYFQTTLAAALLQRRIGLPLVTTAHIGSLRHLTRPIRWVTAGYERTAGRLILARSTQVIAVSESVRKHLLTLGERPERITVVHNGVDLNRFRPSRSDSDRLRSLPLILFIGRLIANKGPQILLDALTELHLERVPFEAIFVGDGPLRAVLQRRANERRMAETIHFIGHTDDVATYLSQADLLIRPSFTEGMPLTVLEAMGSQVCVVASDIAGNRDLIRDHENGFLVPVGSSSYLAQAIRQLLQDQELRQRLAAAGHEMALTHGTERRKELRRYWPRPG